VCAETNIFDQFSECGQREKSRRVIWCHDLTGGHIPTAVVQGLRRGRGSCRYYLTYGGGRISTMCRDLIKSFSFLSEVNVKSRVVV